MYIVNSIPKVRVTTKLIYICLDRTECVFINKDIEFEQPMIDCVKEWRRYQDTIRSQNAMKSLNNYIQTTYTPISLDEGVNFNEVGPYKIVTFGDLAIKCTLKVQ